MWKSLMTWKRTTLSIFSAFVLFGAVYTASETFGMNLPRIAWKHDVETVDNKLELVAEAGRITHLELLRSELRHRNSQKYENLRLQQGYTLQNKAPPREMVEDYSRIISTIGHLKRRMDNITTKLRKR
jgi:hypothetical protein